MTTESSSPADELRRAITDDRISLDSLTVITGIPHDTMETLIGGAESGAGGMSATPPLLSDDERIRVSVLSAQLTEGMRIGDDERLTGILESLTIECRLTPRNLARLTGVAVEDVEAVLRDPSAVAVDTKYALAMRAGYLINAVNRARPRR